MTTQPDNTKARSKWSRRIKNAVAAVALAGVLFSGAAIANGDSGNSDETAKRSPVEASVTISTPIYTQALTWS